LRARAYLCIFRALRTNPTMTSARGSDVIRKLSLALLGSLVAATAAQAADPYPRLASVLIGAPHNYTDLAYQKRIAKVNVAVLNVYPGWGGGASMNSVVNNIKATNPNTRVYLYVNAHSLVSPPVSAWTELHTKVTNQKWWLYKSGTTTKVNAVGTNNYALNTSPYSLKDSSGKTFSQWFANYAITKFVTPNPAISGLYTDNFTYKPVVDGDWNRDGTLDLKTNTTVQLWFRQGYRQYLDALNAGAPSKQRFVNLADWGLPESTLTEYAGRVHGGVIESIIGRTWSYETRLGYAGMMKAYRKTMAALAAPKLGIFSQSGVITDYQAFRYGFASCLMDDGYYAFNNTAKPYNGVNWFDEFNYKLGNATKPPQMTAWQNGVFRRDFEKGIALVNPKGNGIRTVTLEKDYVAIKGTQAPAVNTGKVVRKVTLKDRDGIILMRVGTTAVPQAPAAPEGFVIEGN
jgi:hypothetical protein